MTPLYSDPNTPPSVVVLPAVSLPKRILQKVRVKIRARKISAQLDGGQITHLIPVRLKIFPYDFFRGGLAFFFLPFSFLVITVITSVLGISCAVSTGNVQIHHNTSYDSKTCWAPIRCVIWRSLNNQKNPHEKFAHTKTPQLRPGNPHT